MGKHCLKCGKYRQTDEFNRDRNRSDGLQVYCRPCQSIGSKASYAKNSGVSHSALIRRRYGLSPEEYQAMLDRQGGVCAICEAPPTDKRLAVDHSHETGEVRGLLCKNCNVKLATIENQEFMAAASRYLERKA